jgi:hypothetical protein
MLKSSKKGKIALGGAKGHVSKARSFSFSSCVAWQAAGVHSRQRAPRFRWDKAGTQNQNEKKKKLTKTKA